MWVTQLPLILLIAAAVMTLFAQDVFTALLPWLILVGVVIFAMVRVRNIRGIQTRVQKIGEWTQLGQHDRATRAIWKTLPVVQMMPELHGRLVALMAHNLDRLAAWPAAEVAYDYLIQRMPTDHPSSIQLQLQRTILQLFNDELASADTNLRKLRPMAMELKNSPMAATYHYAALLQHVSTYHFTEAIEENRDDLVENLRPLGVEAGHGYALLAWSCYQLSLRQADSLQFNDELMEQTRHWWHKATLLLSTQKLLKRQPQLKALAAHLTYKPQQEQTQQTDAPITESSLSLEMDLPAPEQSTDESIQTDDEERHA
ncbi:MAG TPA: hypothetical protein DCM28_04485 [Phycisphaerales bacterium]|nr:hypothetical protein [Phycisphaerales bacterium]HCD32631.1 hypothetical protein [Phycisphaerales bacterium]|tara:strand:- start:891 stop:1835 length:945 start_codon:yes stop_codon:yes gene_type:complete